MRKQFSPWCYNNNVLHETIDEITRNLATGEPPSSARPVVYSLLLVSYRLFFFFFSSSPPVALKRFLISAEKREAQQVENPVCNRLKKKYISLIDSWKWEFFVVSLISVKFLHRRVKMGREEYKSRRRSTTWQLRYLLPNRQLTDTRRTYNLQEQKQPQKSVLHNKGVVALSKKNAFKKIVKKRLKACQLFQIKKRRSTLLLGS